MKMKSLIASSIILTLSACNEGYESAKIGNSIGSVDLTGDAIVGLSLSAAVTDYNGFDEGAVTYTWMANDAVISGASTSSYVLVDADVDSTITVTASYTDNNGYAELAKSAPSDAVEFPAVNTEGMVAIEGNAYIGSELTASITDPNGLGNSPISYMWMADGSEIDGAIAATYTLTDAEAGSVITVNVKYTDNDDFMEDATSAPTDAVIVEPVLPDVPMTQAAEIKDTKGVGIGDGTTDTGELRLKLSDESIDPLSTGKLMVTFKKSGDATNNNPNDSDTDNKDAYIGIYGSSTNSGFDLTELRIQDGGYVIRNQDSIVISDTFTDDDWVDVEITWDASAATASSGPMITMSIDGNDVTDAAFPTLDSGKTDSFATIMDGVQHLVFKMGDNDATVAASFYIDDIKLYADTAGTVLVFEDDFEEPAYTTGTELDTDNSPYNSSTNEVTIAEVEAPSEDDAMPEEENLQVVEIKDTKGVDIGDGTKDTGELRLKLSDESIDPLSTGMLSISFRKSGDATNNNPNDSDTDNKDAYIGIYGSSTNSGFDLAELRIQDGGYVIRNQDGITIEDTFTDEDWVNVVITWDASAATASSGPMITMSIDGNDVTDAAFPTLDSGKTDSFATIMDGVQHLVLKMGDNDATVAASFYIDDIKLYSDTAGTILVFEDDFEAATYAVGTELDSDNSRYTSNTNEATIADRP